MATEASPAVPAGDLPDRAALGGDRQPAQIADHPRPGAEKPAAMRLCDQEDHPLPAGAEPALEHAGEAPRPAPHAKKQRRQRVLVDMHSAAGGDGAEEEEKPQNAYERERLERIRSNQEKMREMGIRQMATELASGGTDGSVPAAAPRPPRPPTRRRKHDDAAGPARRSGRTARAAESVQDAAVDGDDDGDGEPDGLIELEEYFRQRGQDVSGALRADGRYRGWVDPAVQARFGIVGPDGAAAGAGPPAAVAGGPKAKGRGAAKAWAGAQLQHNPNAYFYRHVAPGEAQAQGEWTAEEHDAFLATAAAWGVGDRWGLFASWIPQRVGYQCSAYYRDVIIPSGLVLDARFRMQRSGRAAFVG